jgi:hypothetical protein
VLGVADLCGPLIQVVLTARSVHQHAACKAAMFGAGCVSSTTLVTGEWVSQAQSLQGHAS